MNQRLVLIACAIAGLTYFPLISYFQLSTFWQGELILIPVQIWTLMYFRRQGKRKAENIKEN